MFSLRLQGGIPLSEQLEARIAELIIGGEMAENEKLPAVSTFIIFFPPR